MSAKVALVTGGNRGIGLEVCRLLCKHFKDSQGTVIITARDETSGEKACNQLAADGHKVCFVPLDVTSKSSLHNAAEKIKSDHKGLDILINNAGIMYSASKSKDIPYAVQVENTLKTNFFGVLNVCEIMFPLLKENARVVNVSSRLSNVKLYGDKVRNKLCSQKLTKDGLVELMLEYSSKVKTKSHVEAGWPDQDLDSWIPEAYCVSKFAVNILTRILANECQIPGVLINSCCPGWCRSNIGGQNAPKSAEEGAADIFDVIFQESNGGYWEDRKLKSDALSSNAFN